MIGSHAPLPLLVDARVRLATLALFVAALPACQGLTETRTPGAKAVAVDSPSDVVQLAKSNKLLELANKDLTAGRYVSASRRAEEALEADATNADAHAILGAARWRAGDFSGSTAAYEEAIDLDPKNFGAVLGLGRNLQAVGQHARAIQLQDDVLADDAGQIDPRLTKLWSYYALVDADNGVKELDEIFKYLPADDPQLKLVQAYAAFLRPLAGKGPFLQIEGETGSMDAAINHDIGMKFSSGIVRGEFSRVIFFENVEETVVDAGLAKELNLASVGRMTPLGQDKETDIVIVPEIEFGKLKLKNVPAYVQPLDAYTAAIGEKPGVILGRQALQAFGSVTFDFPANMMTVTKSAPDRAPKGSTEVPLLLISMHVRNAPAIPLSIDGSEHAFFAYFGGVYGSSLAVTRKHYLKSGHLPRELQDPEDEANGLKMVYLNRMNIGDAKMGGVGALVLTKPRPDENLGMFLDGTAFELGGYVNTRLMSTWAVTYAVSSGKAFIKVPS